MSKSNQKSWMAVEILTSILVKINSKMEVAKKKIKNFMDNAPCHLDSFIDLFSQIQVVLLP